MFIYDLMIPKIDEIDIEKSKAKSRVCVKGSSLEKLIEILVLNLFALSPFFGSLLVLTNEGDSLKFIEWIIGVGIIFLSLIFLYRVNKIDQLKTVIGKGTKVNRMLINQLINESQFTKVIDKKDHIIAETPMQLTSWGNIIIFILHEGNVLINVSTKGKGGTKSPFHFISESKIWRGIRSKFK